MAFLGSSRMLIAWAEGPGDSERGRRELKGKEDPQLAPAGPISAKSGISEHQCVWKVLFTDLSSSQDFDSD